MRHPHYTTPRAAQVEAHRIEATAREVAAQVRRNLITMTDAIATLRRVGMFETEIAEVLV